MIGRLAFRLGSYMSVRRAALAGAAAAVAVTAAAFGWSSRPQASEPAALDGASLFLAKGCASCHRGPETQPFMSGEFPDLSHVSAWAGSRRPGLDAAAYVRQSIREPWVFVSAEFDPSGGPTTGMPSLAVSDTEVEALVAYLLDTGRT
jgi:mono/diheme cytochrome c family protein